MQCGVEDTEPKAQHIGQIGCARIAALGEGLLPWLHWSLALEVWREASPFAESARDAS